VGSWVLCRAGLLQEKLLELRHTKKASGESKEQGPGPLSALDKEI